MSEQIRKAIPIREGFSRLNISHPTGYRLINAGKLRSFKIGRKRYTTPEAIDDCIAALEREQGAA